MDVEAILGIANSNQKLRIFAYFKTIIISKYKPSLHKAINTTNEPLTCLRNLK
jgi:hypothetical protein